MRRVRQVFSVLTGLVLGLSGHALAAEPPRCVCTPDSFENRWAVADAVFTGTVTGIRVIEERVEYGARDLPVEVTLQVNAPYKNAAEETPFVLMTSLTRDTCTGHPFAEGEKYLVFAYMRKAETYELWSRYNFPSGTYDVGGLCGGTKAFSDPATGEDLKKIAREIDAAEEEKPLGGLLGKIAP